MADILDDETQESVLIMAIGIEAGYRIFNLIGQYLMKYIGQKSSFKYSIAFSMVFIGLIAIWVFIT